jgi:uncharacterized membrane-anchored protein YjiN (DUF445 family)
MRLVATGLLGLMVAGFAACWKFEAALPWLCYGRAFTEAGIVGACADWFAVVALFRHPLGLPIPHTAILPRNKQRIADTIGTFFAGNFFNSAELSARLDTIQTSRWIASWLRDPEHGRLLVHWLRGLLPPMLELLGRSELRGMSRNLIRSGIDSIAAAPLAGRVLAVMVADGQHTAIFDLGLETAIDFLRGNGKLLRGKATANGSKWLPAWVESKATDRFVDGLIETLVSARSPDHPWRREFRQFLDGIVERLAQDAETFEWCERIKSDVLDNKLVDDYLNWLVAEVESNLTRELDFNEGKLVKIIERAVPSIGEWIDDNENVQDQLNAWARQFILSTIVPHRDEIGAYVSAVVTRWDEETLVKRLELQVGKDLQFIRINGTVVGGFIGLILFAITKFLG